MRGKPPLDLNTTAKNINNRKPRQKMTGFVSGLRPSGLNFNALKEDRSLSRETSFIDAS